ncbi:MAG TPA: helix-turn-helix domain-containing protein, partial [Gammaproteobacteria bacterium]|nr:helix-turn-helix domain-containing protein [Gammaproteobacteria bacterium]
HVRRLRQLLEPFGCDGCIQTVRGFGYRFAQALGDPHGSVT